MTRSIWTVPVLCNGDTHDDAKPVVPAGTP